MTIHHVFANRSNIGDWLSARGIQGLLAPHEVVEHLCDEPFVPETIQALSAATEQDLVVIGGGGLFMDYFVPFWEGFLAIGGRVPYCIWGAGFCDMKREDSRPPVDLVREIVRSSRLCVVRDELSRSLIGDHAEVQVVPCPAVAAVEPVPVDGRGLLHVDAYDNIGPDAYELTVTLLKKIAAAEGRRYLQTNNLIPEGRDDAMARTLELYAAADRIVSSRLHGCIVALAMGRRVLAMSGDHKVEAFMESAGLGDWVLDLHEVDQVAGRLEELQGQPDCGAFIAEALEQNRRVAAEVCALVQSDGVG